MYLFLFCQVSEFLSIEFMKSIQYINIDVWFDMKHELNNFVDLLPVLLINILILVLYLNKIWFDTEKFNNKLNYGAKYLLSILLMFKVIGDVLVAMISEAIGDNEPELLDLWKSSLTSVLNIIIAACEWVKQCLFILKIYNDLSVFLILIEALNFKHFT